MKNNTNTIINPWFITGLTDGDGSFIISIVKSKTNKIGWSILILYQIVAENNPANYIMLNNIKTFFGVGNIINNSRDNTIVYSVSGLNNCLIIRNHFINYPLMTYKLVYFKLWSQIINIILLEEHQTYSGLLKIIALKAHFKMGLSKLLLKHFSNFTPLKSPNYKPNFNLMNIYWLGGFINADGSFSLIIQKGLGYKLGERCTLEINIIQHEISLIVLEHIVKFLGVGSIYKKHKQPAYCYRITSLKSINEFISKFNNAQLLGAKALDYMDFCKGVEMVNLGKHFTVEGLKDLKFLSWGMNSKRTKF
jgi:hypothetical protein